MLYVYWVEALNPNDWLKLGQILPLVAAVCSHESEPSGPVPDDADRDATVAFTFHVVPKFWLCKSKFSELKCRSELNAVPVLERL